MSLSLQLPFKWYLFLEVKQCLQFSRNIYIEKSSPKQTLRHSNLYASVGEHRQLISVDKIQNRMPTPAVVSIMTAEVLFFIRIAYVCEIPGTCNKHISKTSFYEN